MTLRYHIVLGCNPRPHTRRQQRSKHKCQCIMPRCWGKPCTMVIELADLSIYSCRRCCLRLHENFTAACYKGWAPAKPMPRCMEYGQLTPPQTSRQHTIMSMPLSGDINTSCCRPIGHLGACKSPGLSQCAAYSGLIEARARLSF
jgi:hypothetical protein